MNDLALKNLIRCKLELAHAMIALLPETIQDPIRNSEREILSALNEAVNDYLKEATNLENTTANKGLKPIDIEG